MKRKSRYLIIAIVLIIATIIFNTKVYAEEDYFGMKIGANASDSVFEVNLVLEEHNTEKLFATVIDNNAEEVINPKIDWSSSDTSIVTVDNTGLITAKKSGTATITALSGGVTNTCKVIVHNAPEFTDFTNAKYETSFDGYTETLKISGITPRDNVDTRYYYIITPNTTKPELVLKSNGHIDIEAMEGKMEILMANAKENYLYDKHLEKYTELNQDLYLWVIEEKSLEYSYYDENGNNVYSLTKFVTEAKEIVKADLPQLNLILKSFSIGKWKSLSTTESDQYTYINFYFPTNTENRKFRLKIGKVTDMSILNKIKNNDYTGIIDLLAYAKNNNAVYSEELTTTREAYFKSDEVLFDGIQLLENKSYYYIYAEFDDENGKYVPVEGITLGQAGIYNNSDSWNLYAYTSSDFQWDNLTSTYTPSDTTTAPVRLPNAGIGTILIAIIVVSVVGVVIYIKYNKYKQLSKFVK